MILATVQVELPEITQGPPGTPGAGIVTAHWSQTYAPGHNTMSADWSASGIKLEATSSSAGDRFIVEVAGVVGHSTTVGTHVPLEVRRNGVVIRSAGIEQHSAVYIPTSTICVPFVMAVPDVPGTVGTVTYELWWKSFSGSAYLGRRASEFTTIRVATSITVTRMLPA